VHRTPVATGEPAIAAFSPTAVAIFTETPHSSARNILPVTISELEPRDEQVRVRSTTADGATFNADVIAQTIGDLDLYPGRTVYYAVKATAVTIYPA
jgi:molybdate transport system ATP-binding protein